MAHQSFQAATRLAYGELAVALNASSMPSRGVIARELPSGLIEEWVQEGISAAGGLEQVTAIAERSRELGRARLSGTTTPAERAEYSALWPSALRASTACGIALHLVCNRRPTP